MGNRFEPRKRTALDGKVWWCVYDTWYQQYSKYCCHGEYQSKKKCIEAINFWNKEYFDTLYDSTADTINKSNEYLEHKYEYYLTQIMYSEKLMTKFDELGINLDEFDGE